MKMNPMILFALASLLAIPSAQAANANSQSSKRGGGPARSTTPTVSNDYAKYYFICSSVDSKHEKSMAITSIVISLEAQRLYAYSGNELVAWSNCSTGKKGHETPVGTFKITQKHIDHYSSIYNNAPMPYFMRLTDDGVGMHHGELPGYAASHGCIRLPMGMVKELYEHSASGTRVQVIAGTVDHSYAAGKGSTFLPKT
jgi:lipoprotein-anchoring transpeptidase ErfK/SrfK